MHSEKTFHETVFGVNHAITLSRSQIRAATILAHQANQPGSNCMKEYPALQTRLHLRMYVMLVQKHDAILHATLGIGLLGSPEPTWKTCKCLL